VIRRRSSGRRKDPLSPLAAVVYGAVCGTLGTVALDAVNYLEYRRGGGTDAPLAWESAAGLDSWEDAPVPALVGKRVVEGLLQRDLPASSARLVNNVTHWAYGVAWGAQYGLMAGSTQSMRARWGPVFGSLAWLSGYVVLPPTKLYKPIWDYDASALAKDWAGHLAYGTTAAAAFRALATR